jgi:sensor domain CHASE-containing protein
MSATAADDPLQESREAAAQSRRRLRWLLAATFLITYLLSVLGVHHIHESHLNTRRLSTQMIAQGYAQRIQERLQTALISTYVLASVVKQFNGHIPNFKEVAAELITLFPGVSALQLAPDGVIQDIYPLDGNEAALGHDLLSDRKRNREAVVAVTTQQLTLAGPFDLVQGGVGAVGRLPIFIGDARNEKHFWGFANALIRIPTLLDASGFGGLSKAGYEYELWRINPDSEQRHVFARSTDKPLDSPVEYVITIYNGRWILSIAPRDGWTTIADYAETYMYGFLVAAALTLLQYLGLRALLATQRGSLS